MTQFRTLASIIEKYGGLIQTGPFGSQLHEYDYVQDGIGVVMPKDIKNGRIAHSSVAKITEEKADSLSRHKLKKGEIVFPRRGDIGKCAFVTANDEGYLCGTGCIKISVSDNVLLSKFLFYYLGLRHVVEWLERNAVGTTMLNLNTSIIGGIQVPMIDVREQLTILSVLESYDDLIENNRRRIELLEQAARLLYKEWFVHLQFPGHEHVKIVDGVPKGWERKLFRDVCETVGGGTPSTKVPEYWENGDITWVTPTDVTRNKCLALLDSVTRITEAGLRSSSAKLVPPNTILMTSRASIGYFALVDREVCTNQGFINILPNEGYLRMYLLQNLISRVDEIRAHAGGSTYPEISKGKFRELPIIMPDKSLLKQFSEKTEVILSQTKVLLRQISVLECARDLLLPRLMNGEIAI